MQSQDQNGRQKKARGRTGKGNQHVTPWTGTADVVAARMRNRQAAEGIQDDRRMISIVPHYHRVPQLVQEDAQQHGRDPQQDKDRIAQRNPNNSAESQNKGSIRTGNPSSEKCKSPWDGGGSARITGKTPQTDEIAGKWENCSMMA